MFRPPQQYPSFLRTAPPPIPLNPLHPCPPHRSAPPISTACPPPFTYPTPSLFVPDLASSQEALDELYDLPLEQEGEQLQETVEGKCYRILHNVIY